MSFKRITELAKEQYETGKYGHCHFKMHPVTVHKLKEEFLPNTPPQNLIDPREMLFGEPVLLTFIGTPIVIDTSLGIDEWQLSDGEGNILEHMRLDEELETHGNQAE